MPVVGVTSLNIPGQVTQSSMAATTQKNFRQMVGEVSQWNPDAPIPLVETWVNNRYRSIIDKRLWYGLMVRGQISIPQAYTTGTALFTSGSKTVLGIGTAWDQTMVGFQIRAGFQTGFYNITDVDSTNQIITLDLAWGNATVTSGYMILQTWVSLGYNIKMVLLAKNQRQGYKLRVNVPQSYVDARDTWRTTTGWTRVLANMPPNAAGEPMYELWPAPTFQQTFPFIAYTQTPDMAEDASYPAAYIRSDVIVCGAISDALLFRGQKGRYFDPSTSGIKAKEFAQLIEDMKMNDDNLYPKDLLYDDENEGPMGSNYWQSHEEVPG